MRKGEGKRVGEEEEEERKGGSGKGDKKNGGEREEGNGQITTLFYIPCIVSIDTKVIFFCYISVQ